MADNTKASEQKRLQGNEFYKKKDYTSALNCYTQAIALNPSDASSYSNRGACLMAMGFFLDAERDCQSAIEKQPDFVRGHERLIRCLIRTGQLSKATTDMSRSLTFIAESGLPALLDSLMSTVQRSAQLLEAENASNALESLSTFISSQPNDDLKSTASSCASIVLLRCEALCKLHRYADVIESIISSLSSPSSSSASSSSSAADLIQLGPSQTTQVLSLMAVSLYELGELDASNKYASETLRLDPDNSQIATLLKNLRKMKQFRATGRDLFSEGKLAETLVVYNSSLELDPSSSFFLANKSAVLLKLRQRDEAEAAAAAAIVASEQYPRGHVRLAQALSTGRDDKFEEAIKEYEIAMDLLKSFAKETLHPALKAQKEQQEAEVKKAWKQAKKSLAKQRGEPMPVFEEELPEKLQHISDNAQFEALIAKVAQTAGAAILFGFTAKWCGPCKQIAPVFEKMAKDYSGKMVFAKVDVDEAQDVANRFQVSSVPTFQLWQNGKMLQSFAGADIGKLKQLAEQYSLK